MAHSARQWEPLRAQQMAPRMYWPQLAHVPPRQQPQLAAAAPVVMEGIRPYALHHALCAMIALGLGRAVGACGADDD